MPTTRSRSKSRKSSLGVSFAAKLGAFMLQSVNGDIPFSMKTGFGQKYPQVFGALPYLHMNVSEAQFRKTLSESRVARTNSLSKICRSKKLDRTLKKVQFSCKKQPAAGVKSLDDALVESVNSRFSTRGNGQKRLREVLRAQRVQVKAKLIPPTSVEWAKGL